MPCYSPIKAFRSPKLSAAGKLSISFNPVKGYADVPIQLPCGQCIGCRLERSRQWAVRAMHEASLHDDNCFLTLTYSDENLPDPPSLDRKHVQLFLKRLRKKVSPRKIRFLYCGEYGEKTRRPHYHLLLFGYDFPDKRRHGRSGSGDYLYTSALLDALWGKGHALIGSVTFESAAYVARYSLKKVTGKPAAAHYGETVDPVTGEVTMTFQPEFFQASLKPGIGRPWLEKYKSDVYPNDYVVVRGHKCKPPRAYDKTLDEKEVSLIAARRIRRAGKHKKDQTKERLRTREAVTTARINEKLPRNL